MKRICAAIASLLFVVMLATPARADTCVGSVCLPPVPPVGGLPNPNPPVKSPVPPKVIYVPGPTKIITKTVPGPTRIVRVPGPTKIVTVPGPTRTVPGPTVTKMLPCPVTHKLPGTKVAQKTKLVKLPGKDHYIKVTLPEAVAFSLLALLLGPIFALLVIYLMYRIGRKDGENSMDDFLMELRGLATRKN